MPPHSPFLLTFPVAPLAPNPLPDFSTPRLHCLGKRLYVKYGRRQHGRDAWEGHKQHL